MVCVTTFDQTVRSSGRKVEDVLPRVLLFASNKYRIGSVSGSDRFRCRFAISYIRAVMNLFGLCLLSVLLRICNFVAFACIGICNLVAFALLLAFGSWSRLRLQTCCQQRLRICSHEICDDLRFAHLLALGSSSGSWLHARCQRMSSICSHSDLR